MERIACYPVPDDANNHISYQKRGKTQLTNQTRSGGNPTRQEPKGGRATKGVQLKIAAVLERPKRRPTNPHPDSRGTGVYRALRLAIQPRPLTGRVVVAAGWGGEGGQL
jgi:hypothetical protein